MYSMLHMNTTENTTETKTIWHNKYYISKNNYKDNDVFFGKHFLEDGTQEFTEEYNAQALAMKDLIDNINKKIADNNRKIP